MFWAGLIGVCVLVTLWVLARWYRGYSVVDLVRRPPPEVDLPEIVTILNYMHHELVKHRLPVVRTVASRPLELVEDADVDVLKQVVTGHAGRPSVVAELDGYLSGLRRAAGQVHLNYWRDPLVRRARRACRMIQQVADGLGTRVALTRREHSRLRKADQLLDAWFRPRLQALRSSVLLLDLTDSLVEMAVARGRQEVGASEDAVELPAFEGELQVRMMRADFDLVLRNLVRNALRSPEGAPQRKAAIEVISRVELTGEESILVRVYDNDPRLLSREELYGGELGRGLNLVTTTLRRYDGALSCRKSKKLGFDKYLEVRLFRAMAEDSGVELLDERDRLGVLLPAAALTVFLGISAVAAAGVVGLVPDPVEVGSSWLATRARAVEPAPNLEPPFFPETLSDAVDRAAAGFARAAVAARADAKARSVRVPPPNAINADMSRCSHQRMQNPRRVDINCRLVRTRLKTRLFPPVVVLTVDKPYDLAKLETVSHEMLRAGEEVREATDEQSCVVASAIPLGRTLPDEIAALLDDPEPPNVGSRLVVDYRACLYVPRYPLRVILTLRRASTEPLEGDNPDFMPVTIDLQVKLRELNEARRAYTGISNQSDVIEQRQDRRRFVRTMAREVANELIRSFPPGDMPDGAQEDLAQALYFGWVRPSVYEAIETRVARFGEKPGASAEGFCDLDVSALEGVALLDELGIKAGKRDLFRSVYYSDLTRLWVRADVAASVADLDAFQERRAGETDFVQGARFMLAVLYALQGPPSAKKETGLANALRPADGDSVKKDPAVTRLVAVLTALEQAAAEPPRKGRDIAYDRVKLVGIRTMAEDETLDEGLPVAEVLCGFREVNGAWVAAMPTPTAERLFGHCPGFERVRSILDGPDAGSDDGIVVNDAPMTKSIRLAQTYVETVQKVFTDPARICSPKPPDGPR